MKDPIFSKMSESSQKQRDDLLSSKNLSFFAPKCIFKKGWNLSIIITQFQGGQVTSCKLILIHPSLLVCRGSARAHEVKLPWNNSCRLCEVKEDKTRVKRLVKVRTNLTCKLLLAFTTLIFANEIESIFLLHFFFLFSILLKF